MSIPPIILNILLGLCVWRCLGSGSLLSTKLVEINLKTWEETYSKHGVVWNPIDPPSGWGLGEEAAFKDCAWVSYPKQRGQSLASQGYLVCCASVHWHEHLFLSISDSSAQMGDNQLLFLHQWRLNPHGHPQRTLGPMKVTQSGN